MCLNSSPMPHKRRGPCPKNTKRVPTCYFYIFSRNARNGGEHCVGPPAASVVCCHRGWSSCWMMRSDEVGCWCRMYPFGKVTVCYGKIHHFQWQNSLFRLDHFQRQEKKRPEGRWSSTNAPFSIPSFFKKVKKGSLRANLVVFFFVRECDTKNG